MIEYKRKKKDSITSTKPQPKNVNNVVLQRGGRSKKNKIESLHFHCKQMSLCRNTPTNILHNCRKKQQNNMLL